MIQFLYLFLGYVCACSVLYILAAYWNTYCDESTTSERVLFVTAHPDDECMFFGPTIVKLAKNKRNQLFLLCLSKGNYEGRGQVRKQELWESCGILGVPESNITVYGCTMLQDDPEAEWKEELVANIILKYVESLGITMIITFDEHGVSKHKNHASTFYATAYLCMDNKLPPDCKAYALQSVNVLRKYSCILDVPLSFLQSTICFITPLSERGKIQRAMSVHRSQYVWFRKLYITFSRYVMINTFKQIHYIDMENKGNNPVKKAV